MKLSVSLVAIMTKDVDMLNYWRSCCSEGIDPVTAARWITGPLVCQLSLHCRHFDSAFLEVVKFSELLKYVEAKNITETTAKSVLGVMCRNKSMKIDKYLEFNCLYSIRELFTVQSIVNNVMKDKLNTWPRLRLNGVTFGEILQSFIRDIQRICNNRIHYEDLVPVILTVEF